MNFTEAYILLHEGAKIKRRGWGQEYLKHVNVGENGCIRSDVYKMRKDVTHYYFDITDPVSAQYIDLDSENKDKLLSAFESIEKLKEGKRIKHKDWGPDEYIHYHFVDKYLYKIQFVPNKYKFAFDELIADDWEIVE